MTHPDECQKCIHSKWWNPATRESGFYCFKVIDKPVKHISCSRAIVKCRRDKDGN